jgi:hypothetical protein
LLLRMVDVCACQAARAGHSSPPAAGGSFLKDTLQGRPWATSVRLQHARTPVRTTWCSPRRLPWAGMIMHLPAHACLLDACKALCCILSQLVTQCHKQTSVASAASV